MRNNDPRWEAYFKLALTGTASTLAAFSRAEAEQIVALASSIADFAIAALGPIKAASTGKDSK